MHQEHRGPLRQAQLGSAGSIQVGRTEEGWEPLQPPVLITTSTVQQQFNSLIQGNRRIGKLFCHPRQVAANKHSLARLCCPSICSPAPCNTPACQQANSLCLWARKLERGGKKSIKKVFVYKHPSQAHVQHELPGKGGGGAWTWEPSFPLQIPPLTYCLLK